MNLEKTGYALIGSLIAGSTIQKNMELAQQYFFIISIGLWAVCISVQMWNCKKEEKIREKSENLSLESRKVIVANILEAISSSENAITQGIEIASSEGHKMIEESISNTATLLNSINKLTNNILENIQEIKEVEADNKNCICGEIATMREHVDDNHYNSISKFLEVTDRKSKDICSQLTEQSDFLQKLINQSQDLVSQQNEVYVSTLDSVSKEIINQIKELKNELEDNKNTLNATIKNENESILDSLSQLMNLLSTINADTKDKIAEIYSGLSGILSNMQSVLDATDSKLGDIQNNDRSMNDLLEDTKNKLQDIEYAFGEGTGKIEEAVTQSMDKQNEIISEEQSILDSYNVLLGRINDEVIAKMISDSNTLLKCMRDCYNLLDSQRRGIR